MKPYVIFLGGTGARCMEALTQTLLAGCTPENGVETISILSADADNANKNLTNARNTAKRYQNFRKQFCSHLEKSSLSSLAKIELKMREWHTKPAVVKGGETFSLGTLSTIGGDLMAQENSRLLTDALYTKREQDEIKPDDFGYVAHPNMGAAILQACLITTPEQSDYYHFFNELCSDLLAGQTDVRLLIVGSLFGGTGASSFPALLSDVDRILLDYGVTDLQRDALKIGAVMIAPYFGITKDLDKKFDVQVDSKNFDAATKLALHYYAEHYADKFHAVYLLGSNPKNMVQQMPAGGAGQVNPHMVLEAEAAQACLHFFSKPPASGNDLFYTYINQNETNDKLIHNWDELGLGGASVAPLARMLYFSLVVHLYLLPNFQKWKDKKHGPDYFTKYIKAYLDTDDGKASLRQLKEETQAYLAWLLSMLKQEKIEQKFVNMTTLNSLVEGIFLPEDASDKKKKDETADKTFKKIGKRNDHGLLVPADHIPALVNMSDLHKLLDTLDGVDTQAADDQGRFNAVIHRAYQLCCQGKE